MMGLSAGSTQPAEPRVSLMMSESHDDRRWYRARRRQYSCWLCHRTKCTPTNKITKQDEISHDWMQLYAFSDSSDADCKLTGKSTGGYVIFLNGSPISWKSARQHIVSLSTMESEYMQCTLTAIEILYLRETIESLGFKQNPTVCYEDNSACIKLSQNPVCRGRSKHIHRRWHFIRECVIDRKEITLEPINTSEQIADIYTKPLRSDQFLCL